jgi:DNA helicase-2/ATP-dependent DNA helicase PcrA
VNGLEPRGPEQQRVVESDGPLLVVLGGAGTGKTVCALAAARAHLSRAGIPKTDRALFLSFSRAAVARIEDRAGGVLGIERERVDVSTFHALAYSIVRRFGSVIDRSNAVLVSPARQLVGSTAGSIGYNDLIPMALEIVRTAPAVRDHIQGRWGLVIVDEFQDTGDLQQELVDELAHSGRRILLGDPDQCIYSFLASDGVRVRRILDTAATAGPENTVALPAMSHRDPTQVIPAVARAIQRREFSGPAVGAAIHAGRLVVHAPVPLDNEVETVGNVVRALRDEGLGVAVFTHHNDMLAALSDGLERDGIEHEIAGLNDALACALDAQAAMLNFACVDVDVTWPDVLDALAVFVTSAQRGRTIPRLARDIRDGAGSLALQSRLLELRTALEGATVDGALGLIADAHVSLGLPSKSSAWHDASTLIRTMHARAVKQLGRRAPAQAFAQLISASAREATYTALTESVVKPRDIQLMNLYQTKGREADATVVVLREGDWLGEEGEPWPDASRLLYVVFSRARQRIVVLPVGAELHPAVKPLGRLATSAT